ncbi:hypothetical protein SALBM311S_01931 [Streptomyces alboniger]
MALDAAIAAGVLVCMVAGSFVDPHSERGVSWGLRTPDPLSLVLIALGSVALVFRRRAPMTVLALTGTVSLVEAVTSDPRAPVAMSAVIALYTVAATTDRPTTWRAGLLTMTVLTGASMLAGPLPWYAQENLAIFAWTGIGATAGDAVRSRRAFIHAIRERAERAERTREEEARRRVAEERLRIARDLHDVVAHHIALVNVQAGVAAHVMDKRPDQAKEALAHVREASRSALQRTPGHLSACCASPATRRPDRTRPRPGPAVEQQHGRRRLHQRRTNGRSSLAVTVTMDHDGSAVAVSDAVQDTLSDVRKDVGSGATGHRRQRPGPGGLQGHRGPDHRGRPRSALRGPRHPGLPGVDPRRRWSRR